ncbi:hypothetical protein [Arthrobacter sp. NPDC090010]|uniref:hypothetical protein n=1 Tax=Arthrobacter sp. NPDC090010 TaxID=3363942 RepID=UPI0037F8FE46
MPTPRLVIVHRRTELEELLNRHGTRGQVEFFLKTRGRDLSGPEESHEAQGAAQAQVRAALPPGWRLGEVEREDLSSFLLAPEDILVVVGQDGLVANAAKYLQGQPVIGVNPEPFRNPGTLVRMTPSEASERLKVCHDPAVLPLERRTMVTARTDDGQELSALNEVFIGHPSHQSARYRVRTPQGAEENHSSSGLIVATGTGSTGWCASIALERGGRLLPGPTEPHLSWFAREAWPSPATGVGLTEGVLQPGEELSVTIASDRLVAFGDGMENDRLHLMWGQEVRIGTAATPLNLVI